MLVNNATADGVDAQHPSTDPVIDSTVDGTQRPEADHRRGDQLLTADSETLFRVSEQWV